MSRGTLIIITLVVVAVMAAHAIAAGLFMLGFNLVSGVFNGPHMSFIQAGGAWLLICLIGTIFKIVKEK